MGKLSIRDVQERFAAYLALNPAWGSLHIVLDDGNVEVDCVEFCRQWAMDHDDPEGAALADILMEMSSTQRRKLPHVCHELLQAKDARP